MINNEKNYKFGIFYYNKDDKRFLVKDTRNAPGINGRAINYATLGGKLIGILVVAVVITVVVITVRQNG